MASDRPTPEIIRQLRLAATENEARFNRARSCWHSLASVLRPYEAVLGRAAEGYAKELDDLFDTRGDINGTKET